MFQQQASSLGEAVQRSPGGFQKPALRSGKTPRPLPATPAERPGVPVLRRLVWAYFWLLLIEGALRKWFLPQLSDPLLIIRDPVALLIIVIALQKELAPRDKLYNWMKLLAAAGVFLLGAQFMLLKTPPIVLLYGYRTAFLHLPLVFLLPRILSYHDVIRMGRCFLIVALPMAMLMAVQFNSPADAWINKTVGMSGGAQITAAFGKIRPPGTFSFISGSMSFFAMVIAFLGYGLVSHAKVYGKALLAIASVAVGLGVAVSGSRGTLISVAIVAAAWAFAVFAGKKISTAAANSAIVLLIAGWILQQVPTIQQGREVLDQRIEMAKEVETEQGGIAGRFFGEIVRPLARLGEIPLFGEGLGVGTNVGAAIQTGTMQFLLAEGEWGRVLFEAGPVFGLALLAFRVALAITLGRACLRASRQGQLLPLLLFSACAVNIVSGQIAQPTILGFTMLGGGLCAAVLASAPVEAAPTRRFSRIPLRSQ